MYEARKELDQRIESITKSIAFGIEQAEEAEQAGREHRTRVDALTELRGQYLRFAAMIDAAGAA